MLEKGCVVRAVIFKAELVPHGSVLVEAHAETGEGLSGVETTAYVATYSVDTMAFAGQALSEFYGCTILRDDLGRFFERWLVRFSVPTKCAFSTRVATRGWSF